MSRRRLWTLTAIVPLLSLYGHRALVGVPASLALARGNMAVADGRYRAAVPELREAARGFNRFEALWRRADSAIDMWENEARLGGPAGADSELLDEAATAYLDAICVAPASRRPWAGLALVYHKFEWSARSERVRERYVPASDPWLAVGRPGRIAIGLGRQAVGRAPNWYVHRDWLARAFWTYGLEREAAAAVREAAGVLPLFASHNYLRVSPLEEAILDDFAAASRASLGRVPLVDEGTQLIDLGKLEQMRGNPEAAITTFEEALTRRLDALRRAEASLYLGLALAEAGRMNEGRERLREAGEHPVFEVAALMNLALLAERSGDDEQALADLRELRRVDQDNVEYCLQYSTVAMRLDREDAALEALRWAHVLAPMDPRPVVGMVEAHWARKDSTAAHTALRDLQVLDPEGTDVARLRALIDVAR